MKPVIYRINVSPRQDGGVGLPKEKTERAFLSREGFEGDFNHRRSRKFEKGSFSHSQFLERAVSIYTKDMMDTLRGEGYPVWPGEFGENLDVRGIDYTYIHVGDTFFLGEEAAVQITAPIEPCKNLQELSYFQNVDLAELILNLRNRRGWYARVLQEGQVAVGDRFRRHSWK